jgi:hypothetical protein
MPCIVRLLIALVLSALLVACKSTPPKPDLPATRTTPEVVVVERRVYVPIEPELTRTEPVAEGPLSMCPAVAAARRAAIERLNARVRQVAAKQGTALEAAKP